MAFLKTLLFIAGVAFFAQVRPTSAVPTDIIPRIDTCAYIPGLSNPARRDVSSLLDTRQSGTSYVTMGSLTAQDFPCIPATVDVSSISASASRAQSNGRVTALGWGSFLKDIWKDVQDVVKIVKDVDALLQWDDVVAIFSLAVDGYQLYTDISKTIIDAKSLDGSHTVSFYPVFPVHEKPDPRCGWGTGKICP